jgi:hypothetical protein
MKRPLIAPVFLVLSLFLFPGSAEANTKTGAVRPCPEKGSGKTLIVSASGSAEFKLLLGQLSLAKLFWFKLAPILVV